MFGHWRKAYVAVVIQGQWELRRDGQVSKRLYRCLVTFSLTVHYEMLPRRDKKRQNTKQNTLYRRKRLGTLTRSTKPHESAKVNAKRKKTHLTSLYSIVKWFHMPLKWFPASVLNGQLHGMSDVTTQRIPTVATDRGLRKYYIPYHNLTDMGHKHTKLD